MADRRVHVRVPADRRPDGLGDVAGHRDPSARLGGLGVLNLEGLWTRYDDPEPLLEEIIGARHRRCHPPDAGDLRRADQAGADRRGSPRSAGRGARGRRACPRSTPAYAKAVVDAGVDFFVIRGTTVSAEHVSSDGEALNLKQFIYDLDVPVIVGGCATHQAALHLMRTGAAGVLVGFGGGAASTSRSVLGVAVPMASAVSDVAAARRDYLDESGGRYVHVIADGSVGRVRRHRQGDRLRGRRGDGRSRWPRRPRRPGAASTGVRRPGTPSLPRGERATFETVGTLEQILLGPSTATTTVVVRCWKSTSTTVTLSEFSGSRSLFDDRRERLVS